MTKKKVVVKFVINITTIIVILGLIWLLIYLKNSNKPTTTEEIAKCIGENAILYTQLGCHACETQEDMFGEHYQYLEVIDCFYEREKCSEIEATPTWKIKGTHYKGVQEIKTLQELTNC